MSYTIEEHKHRSAVWGAATGARASMLCRFPVRDGKLILEEAGFTAKFSLANLPSPKNIDTKHRQWRETIIQKAADRNYTFTHGIAAKLINGYLKDRFVCGGFHDYEKVKCLHPPIDALLLDTLAKINFGGHSRKWRMFFNLRWSKFDSKTYQDVISLMRQSLGPGKPLWKIEQYWSGHQPSRGTDA